MQWTTPVSLVGLSLLLGLSTAGCHAPKQVATPSATYEATDTTLISEAARTPDRVAQPVATIATTQGILHAEDSTTQITVRSQPTIDSPEQGYGKVGDRVTILQSQPTEEGFTWHRVKFAEGDQTGWIRGDFVQMSTPSTPTDAASGAGEVKALVTVLERACVSPQNLNAYYTTTKYQIYICNVPTGYIYVGHQKGTAENLVVEQVTAAADGFVVEPEGYRHRIDSETLQIFEDGRSEPILVEPVESFQLYQALN